MNRTMSLDAYRATGGVRRAISSTADEALTRLEADEREVAHHVFMRLVEPQEGTDDAKRRAQLEELTPAGDDPTRITNVLDTLVAARLVTVDSGGVELAHEALLREWPQLRAWVDEARDGLRLQRHLTTAASSWDALDRDPAELYRGGRLAIALDWLATNPQLSAVERDFLDASL